LPIEAVTSGHLGGRISILDAETGALLGRIGDAGSGWVKAAAISPDGNSVAWCASANLHLQRLPPANVYVHHRIGKTHFSSVAWHPSGGFFATTNGDGKVDFWDAATGERSQSFDWGIGKLNDIAFDPAGDRAAVCSSTGQVVVWDIDPVSS
jgi:WD40 repeat protein